MINVMAVSSILYVWSELTCVRIVGSTTGSFDLLIDRLTRPAIVITTFPLTRRAKGECVVKQWAIREGWVSWSQGSKGSYIYIHYIGFSQTVQENGGGMN